MDTKENEIPVDGNLGLLAVGYRGIMAWREARKNAGINIIAIKKAEYEEVEKKNEAKKAEFEKRKKEFMAEKAKKETKK